MAFSERQLMHLSRARESVRKKDFDEAFATIYYVVSDDHIKSGKEDMHPGWAEMWYEIREHVIKSAPQTLIDEIDKGIPPLVDKSLWELRLGDEERIVVLLGAGASKPAPSNIPVVSELLPQLWKRAAKLDREDLNALSRWCEANAIIDIEDLLTAAHIANFAAKSRGVLGLLDYFLFHRQEREPRPSGLRVSRSVVPQSDISAVALLQGTLETLFTLLMEPMISAQPNAGHKAIVQLVRYHTKTTIVTTNYDGCIDQALEEAAIPCEYFIGTSYPESSSDTHLMKMHGSINWSYCDSCQEMKKYDLKTVRESYERDTLSYPVIGICKNCGGQRRPMIVPPLSFKFLMFPPLTGLWDAIGCALDNSSVIVVVGYSFSEADPHIIKMINRTMGSDSKKKLVIVDTDPAIADRVKTRLTAHFDNFDTSRVIRAIRDCDELLPMLCNSLQGMPAQKKTPKKKQSAKKAP